MNPEKPRWIDSIIFVNDSTNKYLQGLLLPEQYGSDYLSLGFHYLVSGRSMVHNRPQNIRARIKPTLAEATNLVKEGIKRKKMVLVVGDCGVDYSGRASSKMGWGERLLIMKTDGTVLVHRRDGGDPVNWQPPGSSLMISSSDLLRINATRRAPRETLTVYFRSVDLVSILTLVDNALFEMGLTEEEMYRAIQLKPELIEAGLRISSFQKRSKVGRLDATGHDRNNNYVIIEIKKDPAKVDSVKQLYKYLAEVKKPSAQVRGILASPGIRASALSLLKTLRLEFVKLEPKVCAKVLSEAGEVSNSSLDAHLS